MFGKNRLRATVGVAVLTLGLAGCGESPSSTPPQQTGAASGRQIDASSAGTEAARLRAELTKLFHGHASLVAYTVHAAMGSGMESERTQAGIDALHHSGTVLARAIGSAHGAPDAENGTHEVQRFEESWAKHTDHLMTYIEGTVNNDSALQHTAEKKLHHLGSELALILEDLTDHILTEEDVHGMLSGHLALTTTAIDAIVAGDPNAPDNVVELGRAGEQTAKTLTRSLAVATTRELSGEAISPAATLRAELTGLLVEHVSQTVLLAEIVAASGAGSDAAKTATETLKKNVEDLALQFEEIYGKAAAEEFTTIAEEHLRSLIGYAEARASGEEPSSAPSDDRQYAREFARFAEQVTGGEVHEREMSSAVSEQVRAVEVGIDSVAKGAPSAPEEIEHAESLASETATLLALGLDEQLPETYGK